MRARIAFLFAMITVAGITLVAGEEPSGFVSKDGFVPNAEVAVKIAEAV